MLPNGRVLIAGGVDGNGELTNAAEIYDVNKGVWYAAAPMLGTPTTHLAFLLSGGQVFFVNPSSGSDLIYDSDTDRWKRAAPLEPRRESAATRLTDGRVMVIGGFIGGPDSPTTKADIYDSTSDTWRPAAGPKMPRAFASARTLEDGRVLLFGGYNGKLGSFSGVTAGLNSIPRARTAGRLLLQRRNHYLTLTVPC
jgi:hypothetical protein